MDVTPHSSIPHDSPDTCLQVDAETDTGTSTVTRCLRDICLSAGPNHRPARLMLCPPFIISSSLVQSTGSYTHRTIWTFDKIEIENVRERAQQSVRHVFATPQRT